MPPIPEDAVVLADYMLMADFVPNSSWGTMKISKGVRLVSISREHWFDSGSALSFTRDGILSLGGYRIYNNASVKQNALPFFGSGISQRFHVHSDRSPNTSFQIDGAAYGTTHPEYVAGDRIGSTSATHWDTGNNDGTYAQTDNTNGTNAEEAVGVRNLDMGRHILKCYDNQTGSYYIPVATEVHTPTHSSSHYQSFESPFLHELVGGDRNMEQNNLVVTADGKTWDEVTRDVSYIGNVKVRAFTDSDTAWSVYVKLDEWRGGKYFNKDFAIAYDRMICLVDGQYEIYIQGYSTASMTQVLYVNGNAITGGAQVVVSGGELQFNMKVNEQLKRGDYVQVRGEWGKGGSTYDIFQITRV